MTDYSPDATHPTGPTRVWRRITPDGMLQQGHGLVSMRHLPPSLPESTATWQHLDRTDEDGVRTFIAITGFTHGNELISAALTGTPRARVTDHGTATSFTFLSPRLNQRTDHGQPSSFVTNEPLAILVAGNYVLTIGRTGVIDFGRAIARMRTALTQAPGASGGIAAPHAAASLTALILIAVIDQAVDSIVDCADELAAELSAVEDIVFANPPDHLLSSQRIYHYKRELTQLKRAIVPLQRPLMSIIGGQSFSLDETARRRLQESGDRLAKSVETLLYCDDSINSILHANLTQVDVAQNSDMRRIAAWGAILAGWGILAGIYQMTADLTALHARHGVAVFWSTICIGVVASAVLVVLFQRIRWL